MRLGDSCNLCGGEVRYIRNEEIFGRSYGSGFCYICSKCGAYVGTHKTNPKKPLGVLADKEMRELRMKCHEAFDKGWNDSKGRRTAYENLADKLSIPVKECHFAMMDKDMLRRALSVMLK